MNSIVLSQISELRETSDIKEAAQMLHSGNWIAICATTQEPIKFSLGRISRKTVRQVNK